MKVLLATDGSASALAGVQFLRSMAQRNEIDAVVATVSYDPSKYSFQPWYPEWTEQENKRTKKILTQAQTELQDVCRSVELVHGTGAAVPFLLDQAKSLEVDLIMLGAKGHSTIGRLLLGSVSDDIASRAECSVVVVRQTDQETYEPTRILLAYDRSVASREAAAELMQLHFHPNIQVDIHSVVPHPYLYVNEGYIDDHNLVSPEHVTQVEETSERMASQIADHFSHTQSRTVIADHVGDSIVIAAEDHQSDLVIVGSTGHSLFGELLLGSTSKFVLRHAPCSVWISRHHFKSQNDAMEQTELSHADAELPRTLGAS